MSLTFVIVAAIVNLEFHFFLRLPRHWSICQCCFLLHGIKCSVVYFCLFCITCIVNYNHCCSMTDYILKLNVSNQILFNSKNVLSSYCVDTPNNKVFVFSNSSNCGVVSPMPTKLKMETAVRLCDPKKKKSTWRIVLYVCVPLCMPLATWLTSAVKVKFQSVWNQLMEPVVEHPTCIHLLYQDTQEDVHFAKAKFIMHPSPNTPFSTRCALTLTCIINISCASSQAWRRRQTHIE